MKNNLVRDEQPYPLLTGLQMESPVRMPAFKRHKEVLCPNPIHGVSNSLRLFAKYLAQCMASSQTKLMRIFWKLLSKPSDRGVLYIHTEQFPCF